MIGLLIDAAIAVVTILDRVCSAVEQAARPGHSPVRRERATPTGTGFASAATSAGGHLNPPSAGGAAGGQQETAGLLTPGGHPINSHAEPLRWGPDGSATEVDKLRADLAQLEIDTDVAWQQRGEAIRIGKWLIAEARHERDESRAGQPRRY